MGRVWDFHASLAASHGIEGNGKETTNGKRNVMLEPQSSGFHASCMKRLWLTLRNSESILKGTHKRPRLFFTVALVATLAVFAVWSDSHSKRLSEPWRNGFGFSALSLAELRWHQSITSLVLTAGERQFVQTILMLCICVGCCEWQFGSRTAVKVFFASHLTVTIGMALLVVLPMHLCGVEWATALASERDVGPSAGYYGCLGLVVASMSEQKRKWLILLLIVILTGRLAISSTSIYQHPAIVSADVAHLIAFGFGLLLASLTAATAVEHRRQ